jgi:hypothetical protein
VKSDGTVWAWGSNAYGKLGQPYTEYSTVPLQAMIIPTSPTLTTLTLALSTSNIDMPITENITVESNAEVRDQYGDIMTGKTVTYSLEETYTGVSIDSATGAITITPQAQAVTINVIAECEGLTEIEQLILEELPSIQATITTGQNYLFEISASNISSFTNKQFTLTYDPNNFNIDDLCALTYEKKQLLVQ